MNGKMNLQQEHGITDVSVSNAEELLRGMGRPVRLSFSSDTRACIFRIVARWAGDFRFQFTGFSWGYAGTGPNACKNFLNTLGFPEGTFYNLPVNARLELLVPARESSSALALGPGETEFQGACVPGLEDY